MRVSVVLAFFIAAAAWEWHRRFKFPSKQPEELRPEYDFIIG